VVIAGTGDAAYVDALRQLVADLGGADGVRFPGWVDGSRKRDLVAGASLFVLSSKHETSESPSSKRSPPACRSSYRRKWTCRATSIGHGRAG
jgi:hypothetical protein